MTEHNRDKGVMDKPEPKSGSGYPMKDPMKDKQQKDDGQKIPGGPSQHGYGERGGEGERSDKESIGRPVQLDKDKTDKDQKEGDRREPGGTPHEAGHRSGAERK